MPSATFTAVVLFPSQYHDDNSEQYAQALRPKSLQTYVDTFRMKSNLFIAAFGLVSPTNAGLLRFGCAQLTVQRLDPLVNPGANPSPHLHQIIGGVSVWLL
jgi:hypothetical protein